MQLIYHQAAALANRHADLLCLVSLQVWDIASSLSSLTMAANYLHGCHAVLCVHDIAQEQASI
jgi:hypothetical protein